MGEKSSLLSRAREAAAAGSRYSRRKLLAVPLVAAGVLVPFGVHGASADTGVTQFLVGGETVTLSGNFSAGMSNGMLQISNPAGNAQIEIGQSQLIELPMGDVATLSALSDSINLDVMRGQALVLQLLPDVGITPGLVAEDTSTVVSAGSSIAFATGGDDEIQADQNLIVPGMGLNVGTSGGVSSAAIEQDQAAIAPEPN